MTGRTLAQAILERLADLGIDQVFGLPGVHNLALDRKSTRLNSSHIPLSRMPSSA